MNTVVINHKYLQKSLFMFDSIFYYYYFFLNYFFPVENAVGTPNYCQIMNLFIIRKYQVHCT